MSLALDEQYLIWLYSQVGNVRERNKSLTYWKLLRQLHGTEFVWIIPNDDNRVEDGRGLRDEWATENDITLDPSWRSRGCTFLEMLIGLSRRIAFESDSHPETWFWHLLENIGLSHYTDRARFTNAEVNEHIQTVIFRTYDRNGRGGLFPMRRAFRDQRQIEIWYQMNAYLLGS